MISSQGGAYQSSSHSICCWKCLRRKTAYDSTKRILSRLWELILPFWKKNLVIKSMSTSHLSNLLTLILKLLLLMKGYQIRKSLLISTMVKWTFLTTRMTKVLKMNLSPNQELRKQEKLFKLSRILAFFSKFWRSDDEILKRNKL